MTKNLVFLLFLGLISLCKCEKTLSLKIIKSTGDYYTPVSSIVEEKAGANFSLLCDLVSTENNKDYYDIQISWVKQSTQNDVRFWRAHDFEDFDSKKSKRIYSVLKQSEINKAVKRFQPLKPEDRGKYFCVSLKYNLHEVIDLIVRDDNPRYVASPMQEPIFCSQQMFQCNNGVCIIKHYTCDGQEDCKDGSDESEETCNGDPCKDKLPCDDGRCIPMSWCCDRHLDPNCTVTNRPKCCQLLSESYEELEFGPSTVSRAHNGARYIFISVCVLSILFVVVLLLLVMSRVVLFAKKSTLQQARTNCTDRVIFHSSCDGFGTYQNSRTPHTTLFCDVSDPLLYPTDYLSAIRNDDLPPSYIDVVPSGNDDLLNEPPPPYASREVLNETTVTSSSTD